MNRQRSCWNTPWPKAGTLVRRRNQVEAGLAHVGGRGKSQGNSGDTIRNSLWSLGAARPFAAVGAQSSLHRHKAGGGGRERRAPLVRRPISAPRGKPRGGGRKPTPNAEQRTPNVECRISNAECRTPNVENRTPNGERPARRRGEARRGDAERADVGRDWGQAGSGSGLHYSFFGVVQRRVTLRLAAGFLSPRRGCFSNCLCSGGLRPRLNPHRPLGARRRTVT